MSENNIMVVVVKVFVNLRLSKLWIMLFLFNAFECSDDAPNSLNDI